MRYNDFLILLRGKLTNLAKYRRHADECRQEAARALNRRDREGFLKIAEYWSKLAKKMDEEIEMTEPS